MKKALKIFLCLILIVSIPLSLCGCIFYGINGMADLFEDGEPVIVPDKESSGEEDYHAKVDEIVGLLEEYYVDGYSDEELGDYLASAVVASAGDRWSYYISAEEYDDYVEQNNNAYVGIGVTIQLTTEEDPGFTIVSVTSNSPAYEAGLKNGDMIVALEGASVIELGMSETQGRVKGEAGTDVTLTILRDGAEFDVTITRGLVEVDVVVYELMANGVGYIRINNFDANCSRDTLAAIEDLCGQGASSLIFDLRFNPGGRKNELVEVLDYLLPEGPLFRSVDYDGNEEIDYSDESFLDLPMAVLVNEDSYSAAEFFAAAMQEYGAGIIVGTKTTGKANYQQTFRLSDGSAIAISTGHYQTPNGVTLEGLGVTPDVIVEVDDETYLALYYDEVEKENDAQLQAAIAALTE